MKQNVRSSALTIVLFVLAVALLGFGTVGIVQAAPRLISGDYRAQMQMADIETSLVENGSAIADGGKLLEGLLENNGDTELKIGKTYKTSMAVKNTGSIDEYVRVTVRTYWTNGKGKVLDVDPGLIELDFGGGWTKDEAASTKERTVLYYDSVLATAKTTDPFVTGVRVNGKVLTEVTSTSNGQEFDYEGLKFNVEAVADAVQTHSGNAAMTSAWGRTN